MVEQYGTPYCNVHRADYHEILVNKCHELGVTVLLNSRVISSDLSAPSITLASGETIHADLIIGADGLNSHLRASLLGKPSPPYLTGDVAYRILISADLMRADPLLAELVKRPIMSIWMGPNSHAVCYLLKGGSLFNIVLCCPDTLPKGVDTAPAAPGELEELFASWDPRLQRLVAISHDVSKWRLQNSRAMETWVHPGKKFALMGDACHATLPYLAQGAAMAVEDGAMLGALLENIKTKAQLGDLLDLYESLRKPRTERIVLASSHQRYLNHMLDGKEQQERDRLLLEDKPKPGFPNKWKDAEFRDWMFGYNVFEEARIGWERYVSEGRFWELPEAAGSDPSREFGVVAETVKV